MYIYIVACYVKMRLPIGSLTPMTPGSYLMTYEHFEASAQLNDGVDDVHCEADDCVVLILR